MNHTQSNTSDINISRPEAWTLMLGINKHHLEFILYNESQQGSLITRSIPLNTGIEWTQAVENAVYDHNVLLDDYHRVAIVVNAEHFTIMPADIDDELAARNYSALFPEDDCDVNMCMLPQCRVTIAYGLPHGLHNFLMRTFNNAPVYHHLYPLCEHFKHLNTGSTISRMFINMHESAMDMVIYRNGEMMLANSFPVRNTSDAAFLALHTWDSFRLDALTDEIQITGERDFREPLAQQLRTYVKYVMPAIYPASALRLSDDVMNSPLDLILLATCE